jgi:hypothetical protein
LYQVLINDLTAYHCTRRQCNLTVSLECWRAFSCVDERGANGASADIQPHIDGHQFSAPGHRIDVCPSQHSARRVDYEYVTTQV